MQKEQTSIRISLDLLNTLKKFKEANDSYEDVIWDLLGWRITFHAPTGQT